MAWGRTCLLCGGQGHKKMPDKKSLLINSRAIFLLDTRRRWEKSVSREPSNAYIFAYLFVKFLIERFDKEKIIKLFTKLKGRYKRDNFCQNFKEVYGSDIMDTLRNFLEDTYNLKGGENNYVRA